MGVLGVKRRNERREWWVDGKVLGGWELGVMEWGCRIWFERGGAREKLVGNREGRCPRLGLVSNKV